MQVLVDMRYKLMALNATMVLLLAETFNDSLVKAAIEDKIIEQLQRGERGDGRVLPDYSPVSVAKFGKPAGPIKLYDQGDFYWEVTVVVDSEGIMIVDLDIKTEMLVVKYGEEILELQERSIRELQHDIFIPVLQSKIVQYLTR